MAGFRGAGALASALAAAQRRGSEGRQQSFENDMVTRRMDQSVLQQELARAMQERQIRSMDDYRDAMTTTAGSQLKFTQDQAAAKAREAAEARARRRAALLAKGANPAEADALADDEVGFRERMRPTDPVAPRNIDPLSPEGIKAQQQLINYRKGSEGGSGPPGALGPADVNKESALRKEYAGHMSNHDAIASGFSKVRSSAKLGTGQGDMGIIFGFMRMQDPGSTVREGEYATAQNTAGIPDQVRQMYNRAIDGQKLDPDVRARFVSAAEALAADQRQLARPTMERYAKMAQDYGMPSERITYDPYASVFGPQQFEQRRSGAPPAAKPRSPREIP